MWNHDFQYLLWGILALTLATLCTRSLYYLFAHKVKIPPHIYQALQFAPIAALFAIIVPHLAPMSAEGLPMLDIRLIAALLASIVFLKYRSLVVLIMTGMLFLWALQGLVASL